MRSQKKPLDAWVRALQRTAPIEKEPLRTLPLVLDELAAQRGSASALESRSGSLAYEELADRARRYARWALAHGLGPGDVVCLLMPNRPEYLAVWLGLTRVGAVVALLNTNLAGEPLAHSIRIVRPRQVVVDASLAEAVDEIRTSLPAGVELWVHGGARAGFDDLADEIDRTSGEPLDPSEHHVPSIADRALYIYTSGTTGLPKAANVSHGRIMQWSHWFAGMMDVNADDRMYDCLPLYHSVGGIIATGATLVGGGAVVLREKFSASDFWNDVVTEECTLFQYIGELCRYLVNSPPNPRETDHRLRLCCGNGLRPDVWEAFKARFGIPHILEFYAATEGNFSLYNCEEEPGAIGRVPPFLQHRLPVEIVRFDFDAEMPLRNAEGRCERAAANEIGEAIGLVLDGASAGRFEGYADAEASRKKVLRDVFAEGDRWYRTGDLMRRDERGFFYFVDRAGDTFRWKGENVSTAEVASALTACPGVKEAVVYGVAVPGADGRAGMAALVVGDGFDPGTLRGELGERLPDYARPVFLRILPEIEVTGTFKPKKKELVSDAFDPDRVAGPLYFDDKAAAAYRPIDADLYARLSGGGVRV
jgi:fatty-acyl-CoA synthase